MGVDATKIWAVDFFLEAVIFHNSFARSDILIYYADSQRSFWGQSDNYEQPKEVLRINQNLMKVLKKDTSTLHPFPRDYEFPTEIAGIPSHLFCPIKYGQFLRMGLLYCVLEVDAG